MVQTLLIICNLFLLESMLSVDNAAALALIVADLPKAQQRKGLTYGVWGAFIFRGLSLFFVSFLVHIIVLKILGGLYLLWLVVKYFRTTTQEEVDNPSKMSHSFLHYRVVRRIGLLWTTVIIVEMMDMVFSIDNIFAAVAMTDKIYLILIGVFMGIVAMRFVANWFVNLMQRHPSLERSSYIVIALLGVRLISEGITHYAGGPVGRFLALPYFNYIFSGGILVIFFAPLLATEETDLEKIIGD